MLREGQVLNSVAVERDVIVRADVRPRTPAVERAALPSLAWLLVSAVGSALAASSVAGVALGRLGLPVSGAALVGAAAIGALPRALDLLAGRYSRRRWELIVVLIAFAAVALFGLAPAYPSQLPLGSSVDAVHHLRLLDWIGRNQALPPPTAEIAGELGEMVAYPPGFALIGLVAMALTGRPALDVLYPAVALLGGLVAALAATLVLGTSERTHSWRAAGALVVPLLLLLHPRYFVEAYTEQSYYAMVLGAGFALLAGGWVVAERRLSLAGAAQLGLAIAALVATYPLWAPIPAALAGSALLLRLRGWPNTSRSERLGVAARLALALVPGLLLGLADLPQRLEVGRAVLAHEGFVAAPTPASLAPAALALLGVPLMARRGSAALLGLAGLVGGWMALLAALSHAGYAAGYHAVKLLFLLTPVAAAVAGAGLVRLLDRRSRRATVIGAALAALAIGASAGLREPPLPFVQIPTANLVAAASWLRAEGHENAVVVGGSSGLARYWVQVGLLGQPRQQAAANKVLTNLPLSPEAWAVDARLPRVALAPGATTAPPGARAIARFGTVLVVERLDAAEIAALNPLVVHYRADVNADRLRVALELTRPVAGALPEVEVALTQGEVTVARYTLRPEQERTREQYLGVTIRARTLEAEGYVNRSAYPVFAGLDVQPNGPLEARLRLVIGGAVVDERRLARMERTAEGRFVDGAVEGGELVYVHRSVPEAPARGGGLGYGDGLELRGWRIPRVANAGDALTLDLTWRALQPIDRSLYMEVLLLDAETRPVASSLDAPQGGFYPTWRWRTNEAVSEQRRITLPAELPPGAYRMAIKVHDFGGAGELPAPADGVLGEVIVRPSDGPR
jgi:hypothetical protein